MSWPTLAASYGDDDAFTTTMANQLLAAGGALDYLLKARQTVVNYQASGADYSLGVSTTWTTIDSTNMAVSITPKSTRVMVRALFHLDQASSFEVAFDWLNNNTSARFAGNNVGVVHALCSVPSAATPRNQYVAEAYFTGLTPGTTYNFYLQYFKTSGAISLLRNGYPTLCIGQEY